MAKRLDLKDVNIFYGKFHAVQDVALSVPPRNVTAFIGPSGCGKSTVLRTLNRMHEVTPGARVEGSVLLDGADIYGSAVDPVSVRKTIGMVFQRPNPFPTMSIRDNVVAGLRLQGVRNKKTSTRSPNARCRVPTCGTRSRIVWTARVEGSPAVSSSVCVSPGRSRCSRMSCSWTSHARRWTPSRPLLSRI